MRKIAIINQKGGTGKSTSALNVAAGLARKGKKILLIDLDPQGNIATWFDVTPKQTLYHLLIEESTTPSDCVINVRPNLDILPSTKTAAQAEIILTGLPGREKILSRKLQSLKGYDFVLLDCAPSLNLLNQNAVTYATEALIPVSMDYLALVGVKQILENLKMIREILDHKIEVLLVIPTFYDRRNRKSREILDTLESHFNGKVAAPIRTNVRLAEAASHHQTIYEYDPDSHGARDYEDLTEQLLGGRKGHGR
ncbi:ParA family protein [Candidatus Acetothermia bacterium]|nr:ParA family protein [Candidatus Acetothermia bacterium]MBI3459330.1 ParA family protein [Candidatus Acetothermia bacterium]MBI3661049.1 ParA family protein [Candidatus Acetothermia bacterium]